MLVLTPVVVQLLQLGLTVAPEIIDTVDKEVQLLNSGAVPTDAERAEIDAALDAAHQALQAAQPAQG